MNSSLLKGYTAVITGCSRGIGKSILDNFTSNGANCIACIRKKNSEFENYCKDLSQKHNVKIDIVCFDFSQRQEVIEGVKKIIAINKKIDVLVNNAGILFNSLFQMTSEKQLKKFLK